MAKESFRFTEQIFPPSYLHLFPHAVVVPFAKLHRASRLKPVYQQAEGALPNHHTAHPTAPNQIWTFPRTQRASRQIAKLAECLGRVGVETMA